VLRERGNSNWPKAKLTAIKAIEQTRRGHLILASCECGGEREMYASQFQTGHILKCRDCVDPRFAGWGAAASAKLQATRDEWYPIEFRRTWCRHLKTFSDREMLLFETIMDRRRRRPAMMMQAVDIVIRARPGIELELDSFSDARVRRAEERLKEQNEQKLSHHRSEMQRMRPCGDVRDPLRIGEGSVD
jgi:hypothetical protein